MRETQPSRAGDASGHLDLLQRVTEQMTVHHTLEDVLGAITRGLVRHADAALARIWLFTTRDACATCRRQPCDEGVPPDVPSLHLCASAGLFDDQAGPHHCLPLGMLLGGHVAETRRPCLINDLPGEPRVRTVGWIAEQRLQGYAGYPLLFHGELEGVLGIFRRRPWERDEFRVLGIFASQAAIAIRNAAFIEQSERRSARLSVENELLHREIAQEHGGDQLVGTSPALRLALQTLEKVAPAQTTVLLLGETGTGKELLARAVHAGSPRRHRPFIRVDCGAIAPGLVESELFGHERGSFTGALQQRLGRFELAHGGSLFLDEVGEIPLDVQVKLLRVLQEGELERVGGGTPIRTDVRVIAATNRDLQADVAAGRFRADLYYRLSAFPVRVPPLRERLEDLPQLVDHLLAKLQRKLGRRLRGLTPGSLERLRAHAWPGNVRELQNVIERACILAQGELVEIGDAPLGLAGDGAAPGAALRPLQEVEREHVVRVLAATHGVIQGPHGAARLLGLHPNTLRSRMERLGVSGRGRGPGG